MLWHPKHHAALSILLAALLLTLFLRYFLNHSYIPNPQAPAAASAAELRQSIDPNTATAADLAALPTIGPALAGRIIADREAFRAAHPGQTPYTGPADLRRVKGIGSVIAGTLAPYLTFPSTQPAAEP